MGLQPYPCEKRFSTLFLPLVDPCESGSIPSDVETRLQTAWPLQEQLLLREQFQEKFKNSTYSSKR